MIKHVIWSSMIDYPGHTCTVMFTGNCNFNCDYCYNKTLKEQENKKFEEEILPKLIERKDFINHIIISGGEPTVDPDFEKIIDILHKQGFLIGVHTNGSNPDIIINNIYKIDYFGIDITNSSLNKFTNYLSKNHFGDFYNIITIYLQLYFYLCLVCNKNKLYKEALIGTIINIGFQLLVLNFDGIVWIYFVICFLIMIVLPMIIVKKIFIKKQVIYILFMAFLSSSIKPCFVAIYIVTRTLFLYRHISMSEQLSLLSDKLSQWQIPFS